MRFIRFRRRKGDAEREQTDVVHEDSGSREGTNIFTNPCGVMSKAEKQRLFIKRLHYLSQEHLDQSSEYDATSVESNSNEQSLRRTSPRKQRAKQKEIDDPQEKSNWALWFSACAASDDVCSATVASAFIGLGSRSTEPKEPVQEEAKVPVTISFSSKKTDHAEESTVSRPLTPAKELDMVLDGVDVDRYASLMGDQPSLSSGDRPVTNSLLDNVYVLEEHNTEPNDKYMSEYLSMTSSISTHFSHDLP